MPPSLMLSRTAVMAVSLAVTGSFAASTRVSSDIKTRTSCEDVHIFLSRGWMEDYPGRQIALVDAICAGQESSSCGYEDIVFDDSASSIYATAVYQGAVASKAQLTNYANDCPDSRIVISGYSEGAHAMGDALAGGGGTFFDVTEDDVTGLASVKASPGSHISAILLWGDPRHTADQSFNVESGADGNGYFPRSGTNLANLDVFASVMRSYCLSGDPVCAGGDEADVHTSYFESSVGLVDDAASWARSVVGISGTTTATATVQADTAVTSKGSSMSDVSSTAPSDLTSSAASTTTSPADRIDASTTAAAPVSLSSASITASSTSPSASGTENSAAPLKCREGLLVAMAMAASWVLV